MPKPPQLGSTKLEKFHVFFRNSEEFHRLKREIFSQGVYYFETSEAQTRPLNILDIGAHIGVSVLYFKWLYPSAKITALEPSPENFAILEQNIFENQLTGVEAQQVGVGSGPGLREFYQDASAEQWFSTASFFPGAWNQAQRSAVLKVPVKPLAAFLTEEVDFLKMDIEGAEQEVLMSAGAYLKQVRHMIIEFHPMPHQSIEKLSEFLALHGFRLEFWQGGKSVRPKYVRGLFYIEAKRR